MKVLTSDNVVKRFTEGKQAVEVLRGVSLDANRGEIVALEGPSGSGKTTFLSILGCILTPTEERVVVDGHAVDPARPGDLPAIRRRSIGFVFQQLNLFPALTALENVEYSLNVRGVKGAAARKEAERVLETFRDLAKRENRALVVVTHDPKVRTIADRVAVIRDGLLAARISKARIVSPISGVVLARHVSTGETVDRGGRIVTVADVDRLRVEAEVDEADTGRVVLGAPVVVTAEGETSKWRGTVEEIPDAVSGRKLKPQDPARPTDTRVLPVKVALASLDGLKLGRRVEVEIEAR